MTTRLAKMVGGNSAGVLMKDVEVRLLCEKGVNSINFLRCSLTHTSLHCNSSRWRKEGLDSVYDA